MSAGASWGLWCCAGPVSYTHLDVYKRQIPVRDEILASSANVFDAVYNPLETKLLQAARANGSKVVGGMPMLVWQAVASHKIWDGSEYRQEDIDQLCEDSSKELQKRFAGK